MPSQPARTAAQQQSFLELFAVTGTIEGAAELAGIDSSQHRKWLARSDAYRARFQQAFDKATDTLLAEARRRALGHDEPLWHNGRQVGTVRRYSDLLLIFLLKGARPETFRDQYRADWQIHHNIAQAVTVNVIHEFRDSPSVEPPALPPLTIDAEATPTDD